MIVASVPTPLPDATPRSFIRDALGLTGDQGDEITIFHAFRQYNNAHVMVL
jgi:hypothetical protein